MSSPRVYTERCKYPVSALAERGCKSARDIGGQCHLYFKYAVTICTVRSFLQSFFFGLLLQRKSDKRFSGSKPSLLVGGYPWGLWVLFIKDNPSVCLRQPPSRCGSVTLGLNTTLVPLRYLYTREARLRVRLFGALPFAREHSPNNKGAVKTNFYSPRFSQKTQRAFCCSVDDGYISSISFRISLSPSVQEPLSFLMAEVLFLLSTFSRRKKPSLFITSENCQINTKSV